MIITINGDEGSGKTTVAKKLAEKINFPRYTTGEIFREMSKRRGMGVVDFAKLAETDPSIDKEIDDYVIKLSKEQDNFIIDSRVAWHFIPNSLKLYLVVDEEEGARRIYQEILGKNNRNELNKPPASIEYVLKKIRERKAVDDARYMKYYGISIRNHDNYDLLLDTTNLDPDQVFEKVMEFVSTKIDEKSS